MSALRVLLIEDDADHALLEQSALAAREPDETPSPDVTVATSADEALARVASAGAAGFDAVVLDYRLGDTDGLTLLGRLREAGVTAPALLLTSSGSEEVAVRALRAGVADYLPKREGLMKGMLVRHVMSMVERRQLEVEAARAREEAGRLDAALMVARAVAHELNNAAAPLSGYADLLAIREGVAADPQAMSYVNRVRAAVDDIVQRVARLQRIVRLEPDMAPLGPNLPVLDVEKSTRPASTRPASTKRAEPVAVEPANGRTP